MASVAVLAQGPLLRAGLAALLRTMSFDPIDEASDLEELRAQARDAWRPDLVLISLAQGETASQASAFMQEIKAWAPGSKVVFLAAGFDLSLLSACFGAGAAGYILENISREGLQHSLRLVAAGENVFPSELSRTLAASAVPPATATGAVNLLRDLHFEDREIAILRGIANGESNSSIGKKLGISESEVSLEIRHILRKLRVSNRTQAALWAVGRGLAAPFSALARIAEASQNDDAPAKGNNGRASDQF